MTKTEHQRENKKHIIKMSYEDIKMSQHRDVVQFACHFKAIHGFNDRNVLFLKDSFSEKKACDTQSLTIEDLKELKDKGYTHMTQATFMKQWRLSDFAFSNSAIIVDIDYYKNDRLKNISPQHIIELMRLDGLFNYPRPHYFVNSGNGLYVVYLIEHLALGSKKAKNYLMELRRNVAREIAKLFTDYNGDIGATDIARVNKIPGVENYKSLNITEIIDFEYIDFEKLQRYKIKDLAEELGCLPKSANKKKRHNFKYIEKGSKIGKAKSINNLSLSRMRDIEYLLTTRRKTIGIRQMALFMYATQYLAVYPSDIEGLEVELFRINSKLSEPLNEREIKTKIINRGHFIAKKYKLSNEYIISSLEITETEMVTMKTLINKNEKNRRRRERYRKNKQIKNTETTNREKKSLEMEKKIEQLMKQGQSPQEISKMTKLSISQVRRYISNIKKNKNFEECKISQLNELPQKIHLEPKTDRNNHAQRFEVEYLKSTNPSIGQTSAPCNSLNCLDIEDG